MACDGTLLSTLYSSFIVPRSILLENDLSRQKGVSMKHCLLYWEASLGKHMPRKSARTFKQTGNIPQGIEFARRDIRQKY